MFETSIHFERYVSRNILGHTFFLDFSEDAGQLGKFLEMKVNGGRIIGNNQDDEYGRDLFFSNTLEKYEMKTVTANDIHIAKRKYGWGVPLNEDSARYFAYNKMKNCYFFGVDQKVKWKPLQKIIKFGSMIKAFDLDFDEFKRHLMIRFSESNLRWETRINFKKLLRCYKSTKIFEGGVK